MFATSLTLLALAGSCAVQAAPVAKRDTPTGYYEGYLEPYQTYHQRYLSLSCQEHHNATSSDAFFESCCHPLLATESLSDRPAYCTPNATQNATEAANNGSLWNATEADAGDCYNSTSSSVSASIEASSTIGQAAIQTQAAEVTSTTSTWEAPSSTSSSQAPAQTSSSSSSSGSGDWVTGGYATYFTQNNVAGSCGTVHSDSDFIVAMSSYGSYNEYCGRQILIQGPNGNDITVTVADTCPTCSNSNSLDLSVGAFNAIATEAQGMVDIKWKFI